MCIHAHTGRYTHTLFIENLCARPYMSMNSWRICLFQFLKWFYSFSYQIGWRYLFRGRYLYSHLMWEDWNSRWLKLLPEWLQNPKSMLLTLNCSIPVQFPSPDLTSLHPLTGTRASQADQDKSFWYITLSTSCFTAHSCKWGTLIDLGFKKTIFCIVQRVKQAICKAAFAEVGLGSRAQILASSAEGVFPHLESEPAAGLLASFLLGFFFFLLRFQISIKWNQ